MEEIKIHCTRCGEDVTVTNAADSCPTCERRSRDARIEAAKAIQKKDAERNAKP